MGKRRTAARFFPNQRFSQRSLFDAQQHQIRFARAMFAGAFRDLFSGGKMQKAVGAVRFRPGIASGLLRRLPRLLFCQVIDHSGTVWRRPFARKPVQDDGTVIWDVLFSI